MEGLFSLEYLSGPSVQPTKAAYGVSLTSVSRTIAMATSNSPLPLRSDGPTVLLHAVATRRPSDELLYAQYHTDGTLSVGCSPLHPTASTRDPSTRNFPWSLVSSMEPTCMVLSSDARVLCLCTKGGGLVLLPMDALLPAHGRTGGMHGGEEDEEAQDEERASGDGTCAGGGVPFSDVYTSEGLPSLATMAAHRSHPCSAPGTSFSPPLYLLLLLLAL